MPLDSDDPDAEQSEDADAPGEDPDASEAADAGLDGAPDLSDGSVEAGPDSASAEAGHDSSVIVEGPCARAVVLGRTDHSGIKVTLEGTQWSTTTDRDGRFCFTDVDLFTGTIRIADAEPLASVVPGAKVTRSAIEVSTLTYVFVPPRQQREEWVYKPLGTVQLSDLPRVGKAGSRVFSAGGDSFLFSTRDWGTNDPNDGRSWFDLSRGFVDGRVSVPVAAKVAGSGRWFAAHFAAQTSYGPRLFFSVDGLAQVVPLQAGVPSPVRDGRWVSVTPDRGRALLFAPRTGGSRMSKSLYLVDLSSNTSDQPLSTTLLSDNATLDEANEASRFVRFGPDDSVYYWRWDGPDPPDWGGYPALPLMRAKLSGGAEEQVTPLSTLGVLQVARGGRRIFWTRDPQDNQSWMGAQPDGSGAFDVRALASVGPETPLQLSDGMEAAMFGNPPTQAVVFDAPSRLLTAARFSMTPTALFAESTTEPTVVSRIALDGSEPVQVAEGKLAWSTREFVGVVSSADQSVARSLTVLKSDGSGVFAQLQLAPGEDANWSSLVVSPNGQTFLYRTQRQVPGFCGDPGCWSATLHLRRSDGTGHVELGRDVLYENDNLRPSPPPAFNKDGTVVVFLTLPPAAPFVGDRELRVVSITGEPQLALAGADYPRWSPDASTFVTLREQSASYPRTLWLVSHDGRLVSKVESVVDLAPLTGRVVYDSSIWDAGPESHQFSRDGELLSYVTQEASLNTLHVVSALTGQERWSVKDVERAELAGPYTLFSRQGVLYSRGPQGDVRAHSVGTVRAWHSPHTALVTHKVFDATHLHVLDLAKAHAP